jgi:dihydrofolate reductase
VKLSIIAALNRDRVIGVGGKLPWHVSEDLKRFKRLTTGHTVLMGRKTYESMGKPLPNRRNVVLTSQKIQGVETYPTIGHALQALQDQEQVFVIGGGELYTQLLDSAQALYLTIVDQVVEGDTFFPPYEHLIGDTFRLVNSEPHEGYRFEDYERVG